MSETTGSRPRVHQLEPFYRIVRFCYNVVLAALLPAVFLYVLYRTTLGGKPRWGFMQRLGLVPPEIAERRARHGDSPLIWVHAVSAGEAAASHSIVRELLALSDRIRVIISVTTATGYRIATEKMPDQCGVFFLPLDLPLCVRAALSAIRPDILVLMETELWPNLLDRAHAMGVRTVVANGRVSDASYRNAGRAWPLYEWILHCVDRLYVQSQLDADRFAGLRADAGSITVTGNCKFDEAFPDVDGPWREALRDEYGIPAGAPVLVAGSTGKGEDEKVLDAFADLRLKWPTLRLILAPRHPERGQDVAEAVRAHGFEAVRRSAMTAGSDSPGGRDCVVVLDTIGELTALYSIADVVFVGRTLVPLGGSNVLQPLHYGKPVIVGPCTTNFRDTVRIAKAAGICFEVQSPEVLAAEVDRLLSSPEARLAVAEKADSVFREHRGASRRIADGIARMLGVGGPEGAA